MCQEMAVWTEGTTGTVVTSYQRLSLSEGGEGRVERINARKEGAL